MKKIHISLFGIMIILGGKVSAQFGGGVTHIPAWAYQAGGIALDEGVSIAVDGDGYVYTTGNYEGSIDFDPGPGTYTNPSFGDNDVYISKYTPTGNLVWARGFGGTDDDVSVALALDANSNVFITGTFQGNVDFDASLFGFDQLSSSDNEDIFVCKYDSSGQYQWAKHVKGSAFNYNYPTDITIDHNSHIHLTGSFQGLLYTEPYPINDGTPSHFGMFSNGGMDGFAIKLTNDGDFIQSRRIGGLSDDVIASVAIDDSSNAYYTGAFNDTADFGTLSSPYYLTDAVNGMPNCFVFKDNVFGNLVWAKSFTGDRIGKGKSIKLDQNKNVVVLANFDGDVDLDPSTSGSNVVSGSIFYLSSFVVKLSNSGSHMWGKSFTSDAAVVAQDMAIDKFSNIYLAGSFSGTASFDPGNSAGDVVAVSLSDGFTCKLNQSGAFKFVKQIAGSGIINNSAVAIDDCLNAYVTGGFGGSADFRPLGTPNVLTSYGVSDAFVHKIRAVGACGRFKSASVDLNDQKDLFMAYPNPTSSLLTLSLEEGMLGIIEVCDQSGRQLMKFFSEESTSEIDMSNFDSGIYFIHIEIDGAIQSKRVTKN